MEAHKKYISKEDFHNGKPFIKINNHINTCLLLIEKLIKYNIECRELVKKQLIIEDYIIDYRLDQFGYYHNTLKSIYYSCYSLKNIFDISTYMNLKNIENTIGDTLENQKAYVTFTGIVKLSSIFEYTRKIYEENIASGSYFSNMKNKYSEKAESLELLNSFRNTIHTNGDWHPKNKKDNLVYKLRSGEKIIKPGQPFEYDHWKLYRIVKDCIELNKLMALDNQPKKIRQTKLEINGQRLSVMKTDLSLEDWDKILPE